jgi:hypothetical protein
MDEDQDKLKKSDPIAKAFWTLQRSLDVGSRKPFKLLRKTAASKLATHPVYPTFRTSGLCFLGIVFD